jgi:hypothetical protein
VAKKKGPEIGPFLFWRETAPVTGRIFPAMGQARRTSYILKWVEFFIAFGRRNPQ